MNIIELCVMPIKMITKTVIMGFALQMYYTEQLNETIFNLYVFNNFKPYTN
jgi:hypothetical protein